MIHSLQMLKSEFFIFVFSFSRPCGLHLPNIFRIWPLQRREPLWYPQPQLSHHPFLPELFQHSKAGVLGGACKGLGGSLWFRTATVTSGGASCPPPAITHCIPAIWPPAVPRTPKLRSFPGTWHLQFCLPGMFFRRAHILHVIFPARLALSRLLKIIAVP